MDPKCIWDAPGPDQTHLSMANPTGFCQTDGCCLLQAEPDMDHAFGFIHLLLGMFLFLNLVPQYSSLLLPQCIDLSSVSFIPEHPIPPACEPLYMVPGSLFSTRLSQSPSR